MQRYKKILLAGALVLALVAVAVVAALRFLPETDLIRNTLRDRLSASTGHNVSLGALKVSLSFPHLLSLTLEGISVSSHEGKRLVLADRVSLAPSLASLFGSQLVIESITVDRLHVFVRRAKDGTLEDLRFGRVEKPQPRPVEDRRSREAPPAPAPSEQPSTAETLPKDRPSRGLTWSVDTVKIVDARIEWIDREIVPGEPARISVDKINCTLQRQKPGNTFAVDLGAELSGAGRPGSPIAANGAVTFDEDFSELLATRLNVSLKALNLKTFQDYVPPWARPLEEFDVASSRAEVTWKQRTPTVIAFKTEARGRSPEAPQITFQGVVTVTEDLSRVIEIRGTGESDRLPLRLISRYLPKGFPFDPNAGTLKASIQGQWMPDKPWKVQGNVGLEDAVPAGPYKKIAKRVRVWSQSTLTPERLAVENLEISGPNRLASLSGTVIDPFSDKREFDLQVQGNLEPSWLKDLGVILPKGLVLKGTIPVQGRGRGKREDVWLDLSADVTTAAIKWSPYVEKAPGNKGSVSVKGKFLTPPQKGKKRDVPEAVVRVGLSGVTVRTVPGGPRLSKCAVQFDSKVRIKSNTVDLKGATLALRRGSGARNLMVVRADVADLGSPSSRFNGTATVTMNRTTLTLCGLDLPRGVRISGSAQLHAKARGSLTAMDWAVNLPLTHLDIVVDKAFKKLGGVKGNLTASGKWALKELALTDGKLSLPGLTITGSGNLRDRNGKFRGLTLVAKKAELSKLAGLAPALAGKGFSGPADLTVRLRPSDRGVSGDGKIRLIAVDFRPENAGWSIRKVKGTLETDGTYLESSELSGLLTGPVEGPLFVKGKLNRIQSTDTMNGRVTVRMGKGRINAGKLRRALGQAQTVLNVLFRPDSANARKGLLDFDSGAATLQISSGTARTDDLQIKGPDIGLGSLGALQLKSQTLDLLVGVKTYTIVPGVLGKIPVVRKLVKKHKGVLKALGIDKELERLGVGGNESKPGEPKSGGVKKTPVVVILKATGRASDPKIVPVLESSLSKQTAQQLKALMN